MIHQDARVFLSRLADGHELMHPLAPGRYAWLQVLRGAVSLNGDPLQTGDGAAVSNETRLDLLATGTAEILLFDLP